MKKIVSVSSAAELGSFIDFPHTLYKSDPNYVPALYISEKQLLTKHPFYLHSEIQLFLAYDDERIAGRIAAIHNKNYVAFSGKEEGFFGFFDCENNTETAAMLFGAVEEWLQARGIYTLNGPVNPSTNETCGMLVRGFDRPPMVLMPYNASYYETLAESCGFEKLADLIAYEVRKDSLFDKTQRILEAFSERLKQKNITIRPVDLRKFDREVDGLMKVYNKAWDKNLGFVPMTDAEFKHLATDLRLVLDKDFCLVAEMNGEIIGFALGVPDINQAQIRVKRGRLFPFGLLKLLWYKRKTDGLRVLALGVLEPYRKMGIEAVMYGKIIQSGLVKGYTHAEASWILEDNELMNRAVLKINGKPYKTYRIFQKRANKADV